MVENVGMHSGASAGSQNNEKFENTYESIEKNETQDCVPNNRLPQRKNIRAEFHNYSGGDYFVTICTRDKEHYFGEIINGEMILTNIGQFAETALHDLPKHYKYVKLSKYVIMPNHVHAIICIRENADAPGCVPTVRSALGVVVGGFKQSVTCFARRNNIIFGWQSRFHDHIIRGVKDGGKISEYIDNNVTRWADDCFNK